MKYTITLLHSLEGGYVAAAPALPGCISQGNTREEALANIREAVELYLEDLKESGEAIPSSPHAEIHEIEINS
jgi:predicted RNase H-like HicB family nuclease